MNRTIAVFVLATLALAAGLYLLVRLDRSADPSAPADPSARRIVSTSRHATETLFGIGAGDQVVGVCQFCVWPPEVADLPRIGGYYDLDLEAVNALDPDLVVLQGGAKLHRELATRLEGLGTPTLAIPNERLEDLWKAIELLGQASGHEREAAELEASIRRELDQVRRLVEGREPRRVLVVFGREGDELRGLYAAGRRTFLDDLLSTAGGENVLPPGAGPYPQISAEDVLAALPDVILEVHPGRDLSTADRERILAAWAPLQAVPAVAGGRIEFATEDYLLVNGPRVGLVARRFAGLLHPEVAPE